MPAPPHWLGELLPSGSRKRSSDDAVRAAEIRAHAAIETLDALLLDRADGAALWAGRQLQIAVGVAEPLADLEEDGDPGAIAAMLVAEPFRPSLADAVVDLLDTGTAFEISAEAEDGINRSISGRTLGGRALLSVVEHRPERLMSAGEQRLHHAERNSADLAESFDHAPIYAWRRDADGALIWANRAYVDAVEAVSLADAIETGSELVAGKNGDPIRELAERARTVGRVQTERAATVIAGDRRILEFREVPVVGGTLGFATDVTAQSTAADALRRQIEANELTLDRLHRGVAVFSNDLRLTYFNEAIAQLWGLSATWLEGHPALREILNALRERGKVPQSRNFSAWRKDTLERYGMLNGPQEAHWHLPDGGAFHVLAQPHPLGGLLLVFEDVTDFFELKRDMATVSAVQRAAFARLNEGILVLGLDGRRRLSNPAFETMWGLNEDILDDVHIREIATLCAPLFDDDAIWARMVEDVSGATEGRRPWSERLYRKDGTVLSMASAVLPDGATMFAFTDITDSVNKERALRVQNEKLEELSILKSAFLDSIHDASQELKIPLNTIIGFSELLAQGTFGELNDKQRDYVQSIGTASNDLRQIVAGITDLAMIKADHLPFRIEQIPVKSVLETTVRFVERSGSGDISFRINCPDRVGPLPGDAPRFREIVHHLLNTVRVNVPDGATVEVGVASSEDSLSLWIGPEGANLPTEIHATFGSVAPTPGSRTRSANTLGIAFARQFIERQGGRIALEANIGSTAEAIVCRFLTSEEAVRAAVGQSADTSAARHLPSASSDRWNKPDSASRG